MICKRHLYRCMNAPIRQHSRGEIDEEHLWTSGPAGRAPGARFMPALFLCSPFRPASRRGCCSSRPARSRGGRSATSNWGGELSTMPKTPRWAVAVQSTPPVCVCQFHEPLPRTQKFTAVCCFFFFSWMCASGEHHRQTRYPRTFEALCRAASVERQHTQLEHKHSGACVSVHFNSLFADKRAAQSSATLTCFDFFPPPPSNFPVESRMTLIFCCCLLVYFSTFSSGLLQFFCSFWKVIQGLLDVRQLSYLISLSPTKWKQHFGPTIH